VDIILEEIGYTLEWNSHKIDFISTPGHSNGSICILINNKLFSGDTIMQYKPFIPRKRVSIDILRESINSILLSNNGATIIYPGHGEPFLLSDYKKV